MRNYKAVEDEVMDAYADANDVGLTGSVIFRMSATRNLHFRAFRTVPAKVAAAIMAKAVPRGYNNFHADLLNHIKGQVLLAREYSVCVYVSPGAVARGELGEDEYNVIDGKLRLWWD